MIVEIKNGGPRFLRRVGRAISVPWKIYGRKSLGHPGFVSNPYPLYHWLRQREPVREDPLAPVWVLTRFDDVCFMLREGKFKKDPFAPDRVPLHVRRVTGRPDLFVESDALSMLFLDPPEHTRVRSVFARAFTPGSLASLQEKIEVVCRRQLDRVEARGEMDLIGDLAYPLPVIVIAEMLGFPSEDYPRLKRWSDDMTASLTLNATQAQREKAAVARGEIRVYFDEVVGRLRGRKTDSLLSQLLECEDQANGLSREEIFTNAVLLLAAGHETTTNLIGNGVLALMRNREQWEELVAEPALIEAAVEEILRYDSPVQWTSRLAGEDVEIDGHKIPEGRVVLGCVGAANRDPAKFIEPDKFDIRRTDNKHLSFGAGIHFCLGSALARMEAQIVIGAMAQRFSGMRPASPRVKWIKGMTFRGVTKLLLRLRG